MKARLLGEKILETVKEYKNVIAYVLIICCLIYFICFLFTLILFVIYFFVNIYMLCDRVLYAPEYPADSRKNVDSPSKYSMTDYECSHLMSDDQVSLNYIFLRKPEVEHRSRVTTVLYLHGNAGNIGHRLDNALEMYRQLNVNVFMLEYRGYGSSGGKPSEKGLILDTISALRFLQERTDIDTKSIVVFGRSLGGAVAIGAVQRCSKDVKLRSLMPMGLIVENTFTSVPDVARKMCHEKMNPILAWLICIMPGWFYKSRFDSRRRVKDIDIPVLFISGLKDELLPASMMEDLFNTTKSTSKRINHFATGTHNFTWKCTNYYETIQAFLVPLANGELGKPKFANESIAIPIGDLERSPLIDNEDGEWRTLCNTGQIL